jgi:hypothetical protein
VIWPSVPAQQATEQFEDGRVQGLSVDSGGPGPKPLEKAEPGYATGGWIGEKNPEKVKWYVPVTATTSTTVVSVWDGELTQAEVVKEFKANKAVSMGMTAKAYAKLDAFFQDAYKNNNYHDVLPAVAWTVGNPEPGVQSAWAQPHQTLKQTKAIVPLES